MATQVQNRRGSTAEHSTFTGAVGEVTIDTDKDTAVVHDGSTAGGRPLLREDLSNLPAGTIDNADINASAAIAGSKISPNFGSQNVVTTGTNTAASFIPTSSTAPTNGLYLSAANTLGLATNGTGKLFVDANGNVTIDTNTFYVDATNNRVGIGTVSPGYKLDVSGAGSQTIRAVTTDTSGTAVGIVMAEYTGGGGGTNTNVQMRAGDNYAILLTSGSAPLLFCPGTTEKARLDSSGRLLLGTSTNTGGSLFQVNDNRIRIATAKTPASATDTGSAGEICWDANYIYVCTATNTWKRTAISTW